MIKVFLDPGHGGRDPGAMGNYLQEKDINLSVALKIGRILKRHNVKVLYSRATDVFVDLSHRTIMANNANVDIFVSIHCNSFDDPLAQGIETFSHTSSVKGSELAKSIQDHLVKDRLFTRNRGIKTADFAVLRLTKVPAALIELAFISNDEDANILRNKQSELAESITKGILKYLGIIYVKNNAIDIPSPWAKESWEWAKEKGIIDGSRPRHNSAKEEIIISNINYSDNIYNYKEGIIMDKFKDKLYSDNLHNYDYDELVEEEFIEEFVDPDMVNRRYRKFTNTLRNSYNGFHR